MDSVTGTSSRPLHTTSDTTAPASEEASTPSTSNAPQAVISYNPDAISAATVMAILAHQNQQSIELNSDQQLVRNGELVESKVPTSQRNADTINALVNDSDGSDLFTRLETARQGRMSKADGKMSQNDLKAALANGGLSPDERATAEYLLANFDEMKSGKYITKESLGAFSLGLSASNDPEAPLEGLQSFVDGGDGRGAKNRGMDGDFKDLANGRRRHSVSMSDLQKGLNDPDFSAEQKKAIQYMIDNFDTISHGNDTISFKELDTFVSGLQQGVQANSQSAFESFPVTAAILMEMGLTEVSKEELQNIIASGTLSDSPLTPEQLQALTSTLAMFDEIKGENGKVSVAELNALSAGPEQGLAFLANNDDVFRDIAKSDKHFMLKSWGDLRNDNRISKEELTAAIDSGKYQGSQKAALIHLRNNFDAIAGEGGQISQSELKRAAITLSSTSNLESRQIESQASLEAAIAHVGTFSDTANNASFLERLDLMTSGDDRNYRHDNFIDMVRNTDVKGDRSTFVEPRPITIFGQDIGIDNRRTQAPDGNVSRNDLEAALGSSNFSESEKAFIRITLENFSEISGGNNTISNGQMQDFAAQFAISEANSFDSISADATPTVPLHA